MREVDFLVIHRWIQAEAKVIMAKRTYTNARAIGEAEAKADVLREEARHILVTGDAER
jgi:hypothetical protein